MSSEEWRRVAGHDAYEVSSLGRVRSYKNGKWGLRAEPRIMSPGDTGSALQLVLDGVNRKVHRLVAAAFLGESEGEVCHNDGDYRNNAAENLRYDTHRANGQDMIAHGTSPRGRRNGQARLDENAVLDIVARHETGNYLQRELADEFGVSRLTIGAILTGRNWGWLTGRAAA